MKKFVFFLILILCCTVAAFALPGKEDKKADVKIGFIGPLTGDTAEYGVRCLQAVKLAFEKVNGEGGIDGKNVVIVSEDSEGVPEKALAAYEKLANTDKVCCIIGPVLTGETFAVADKAQEDGILIISPSASHKDITSVGDYIFRTTPSDGLQGEVAGYYFADVLGYKKIAVLYAKNDYSQGLYEGMKEAFEKRGGQIVGVETCMVGDKDFKTQLTKLRQLNPQAIYIPDYYTEIAQILEQASQLGMNVPFLSCDGFSNPEIFKLAGPYTKGIVYFGSPKSETSSAYEEFYNTFDKKYGWVPDIFATNAYDASLVLTEAIKKSGTDRKAIRKAVSEIKDFNGVQGIINFEKNGDIVAYQGVYEVKGTTLDSVEYKGSFTVTGNSLVKVD